MQSKICHSLQDILIHKLFLKLNRNPEIIDRCNVILDVGKSNAKLFIFILFKIFSFISCHPFDSFLNINAGHNFRTNFVLKLLLNIL